MPTDPVTHDPLARAASGAPPGGLEPPRAGPVDVRPASIVFTTTTQATSSASLLDRLARVHRDRRQLREMERTARHLADALEEAAGRIRRGHPVHPPIERLIPKGGITRYASDLRDLKFSIQRAEEAIDREVDGQAPISAVD